MDFKARVDITGPDKKIKYKKGDVISKEDSEVYLRGSPEYLEGLEFRSGRYHLPKKLSKKEIIDLNKEEQEALIKELGGEKIPKLEKDRVSLILKLQK